MYAFAYSFTLASPLAYILFAFLDLLSDFYSLSVSFFTFRLSAITSAINVPSSTGDTLLLPSNIQLLIISRRLRLKQGQTSSKWWLNKCFISLWLDEIMVFFQMWYFYYLTNPGRHLRKQLKQMFYPQNFPPFLPCPSKKTTKTLKGLKREGTYVYLWLIHVDVWQKPI